eukprot:CAMPEP_0172714282 /NCGR_PEP_ID=MMETSP1074-20121228/65238_1 /TAXON_ID=2916 /ORGANISM="Ceratium fusus, Strain PA161109" /LENGTH=41 /DNA_ID= /DNA_START= /DNA_END= /DNA_ORIENTATION=
MAYRCVWEQLLKLKQCTCCGCCKKCCGSKKRTTSKEALEAG